MEPPICKVHGKPMREGKFGWFCPTKDAQGNWCQEKFKPPKPEPVVAVPVAEPVALPKTRLAEAALAFAGRIYQGTGSGEDALSLAASAYTWLIAGGDDVPNF